MILMHTRISPIFERSGYFPSLANVVLSFRIPHCPSFHDDYRVSVACGQEELVSNWRLLGQFDDDAGFAYLLTSKLTFKEVKGAETVEE